jgi:hypothetical protein
VIVIATNIKYMKVGKKLEVVKATLKRKTQLLAGYESAHLCYMARSRLKTNKPRQINKKVPFL